MKSLFTLLIMLLSLVITNPISRIAEINKAKKAANEALAEKNFEEAIKHYHILIDSLDLTDAKMYFNLGNAYYQSGDSLSAMRAFQSSIEESSDKLLISDAYNQQGVIVNKMGKPKEAMDLFKKALRNNPQNEEARYNYELLKKLSQNQSDDQDGDGEGEDKNENQEQQEKDQNKDQDGKNDESDQSKDDQEEDKDKADDQDQNKQDQDGKGDEEEKDNADEQESEGEEGDEESEKDQDKMPQSTADKLKEMNISEEKAQMILEAMRNAEAQYLQQLKKKPTKKVDPNMPDW